MDDFDDIRVRDLLFFERLASLGSITAAARELQVPKATASRWLAQLEERVDVSLVKRTTRSVALTEKGKEFLDYSRSMLATTQAARLALNSEAFGGTLRVSVPVPMGRMLAGPVIARFRRRMPTVRLEIKLQNERVDLIKEGFDLAIRGGALSDSDYLTRRLTAASMWLYVSARFRDHAVSDIPFIASPGDELLLRRAGIESLGVADVLVDDRTAVADALAWGAGIGLLPSFLGQPACEAGSVHCLDETPITALPVHAVYHASQREDPRLAALIDEIEAQLDSLF